LPKHQDAKKIEFDMVKYLSSYQYTKQTQASKQ